MSAMVCTWAALLVGAGAGQPAEAPPGSAARAGDATVVPVEADSKSEADPDADLEPEPEPEARWFLAGRIDARLINLKSAVWFGYGDLVTYAIAAEAYAHVDTSNLSVGGGLRGQLYSVELRLHVRYALSFGSALLTPLESYDRFDLDASTGPGANYFAVDAMAKAVPKVGPGWLRLEASLTAALGIEEGWYVMEARTNAIIDPPWVWAVEVGYLLPVTADGSGLVGPNLEVVGIPGRDELVWRAGGRLRWDVYPGWQVRGMIMAPFSTPDNIGLEGGTQLELGVRYHWSAL